MNSTDDERTRTRQVFARVMIVQILALALLWFLQSRYTF
jgi:hypothetical protein